MPEINAASNAHNMIWQLVDVDTGKQNWEIDWAFRVGDLVKIRLLNDMDQDHPMHHPFHIHGAGRFLILARDDVVESNLAWKDTVLVRSGETVDILLEVTNPGLVDGALPHRRTQPGRDDVLIPSPRVLTRSTQCTPNRNRSGEVGDRRRVAFGESTPSPAGDPLRALGSHQPLHPLTTDLDTQPEAQLGVHPGRDVGAVGTGGAPPGS